MPSINVSGRDSVANPKQLIAAVRVADDGLGASGDQLIVRHLPGILEPGFSWKWSSSSGIVPWLITTWSTIRVFAAPL